MKPGKWQKYTAEELSGIALDEVKKMIEIELPDAFKNWQKRQQPKKVSKRRQAVFLD